MCRHVATILISNQFLIIACGQYSESETFEGTEDRYIVKWPQERLASITGHTLESVTMWPIMLANHFCGPFECALGSAAVYAGHSFLRPFLNTVPFRLRLSAAINVGHSFLRPFLNAVPFRLRLSAAINVGHSFLRPFFNVASYDSLIFLRSFSSRDPGDSRRQHYKCIKLLDCRCSS
jgi:hypothetical protein